MFSDLGLITEIVGYFASFMVLISFLMRDIKKLRLVNSVGCVAFVIYGILLNWSLPIVITNMAIVSINLYYLFIKKEA
ncbi:uroporphyrinogen decarboxylase [Aquimarina sp. 2201CG5-10]|nr:uroporphyrinogen decarboxylase [Aquimarina sp. 2201CG5-10]